MSKAKATPAEQALQDAMRAGGCVLSGSFLCVIHHIQGMQRKEWAIVPLADYYHSPYGGLYSIHRNKERFRNKFGHEWTLYFKILNEVINDLKPEHRVEILQKIDDYKESGHASVQFLQAYDRGRVGI